MSKAFTKESDAADDEDDVDAGLPPLPAGTRNYMTPAGYSRLRGELMQLLDAERPKMVEVVSWAAKNGDRSENGDYLYGKKRLREIDRRIRFLTRRLDIAEVADPSCIRQRPGVLRRPGDLRQRAGRRAHGDDQGHRRGRQPARRGVVDLADRAGLAEGAPRRRSAAAHARQACSASKSWTCVTRSRARPIDASCAQGSTKARVIRWPLAAHS